jgi:virginiamycin B lyase
MMTRRNCYSFGAAAMTTFGLVLALSAQTPQEGLLTGTIMSATGTPVEGVAVSAQIAGEPITVSVYTHEDGRYFFPPMKGGQYKVWAQAVGLERSEETANLGSGVQRLDFKMKDTTDIIPQLSGYQVLTMLPEDTAAHRRGKVLFQKNCTYCHETSTVLRDRFDQPGWEKMINAMMNGFSAGPAKELTPAQKELAAYLAEMRGPGPSPMKPPAQLFRPTGEGTSPVVYLYDVEYVGGGYSSHNGSDWRFGAASSAGGAAGMHDSVIDADGNFWLTSTQASAVRTVARVDGKTGKTLDFAIPLENGRAAASHGMMPHTDGKIYFNASPRIAYLDGTLGVIDPKSQKVESIRPPDGMTLVSGWLNSDGKGYLWTASGTMQAGAALRFDPRTKAFLNFKSPTAGMTYGIAGDRDGNGWWMGVNEDIIVIGDPVTGKVSEIQLPPPLPAEYVKPGDFSAGEEIPRRGLGGQQSPRRPSADLAGNSIWVPNFYGNTLVKIDAKTKEVKFYGVPYPGMNPYEAMIDSQHRVWLSFQNSDEVGRFDPTTEKWTIYSWPFKGAQQRQNHMIEKEGVVQLSLASGAATRTGKMVMRSARDIQALRDRVR